MPVPSSGDGGNAKVAKASKTRVGLATTRGWGFFESKMAWMGFSFFFFFLQSRFDLA